MDYAQEHYVTIAELKRQDRIMRAALDESRNDAIHLDAALKLAREQFSDDRAKWDERAERYKAQILKLKTENIRLQSRVIVPVTGTIVRPTRV